MEDITIAMDIVEKKHELKKLKPVEKEHKDYWSQKKPYLYDVLIHNEKHAIRYGYYGI